MKEKTFTPIEVFLMLFPFIIMVICVTFAMIYSMRVSK